MPRLQDRPQKRIQLTTYDELEKFLLAFVNGFMNFVVVVGGPGLQKSRLVKDIVGDHAFWFEGNATPFGVYCGLWTHHDELIVLDDVDRLQADPRGVRLLKSLCQSDSIKTVAWDSDARTLKTEGIPRRFTTRSRLIVITNEWNTMNRHVAALEDRGHILCFA